MRNDVTPSNSFPLSKSNEYTDTLNCESCDFYHASYELFLFEDSADKKLLDEEFFLCGFKKKCYEFWCIYAWNMLFVEFSNIDLALRLLREAFDDDFPLAGFTLAKYHIYQKQYVKAVEILEALEDKNFVLAKFELANIYLDSRSYYSATIIDKNVIPLNIPRGLTFLEELVKDGMIEAQYKLGLAKKLGEYGLPIDTNVGDSLLIEALNNPQIIDIPGFSDDIEMYLNNN